MNKIKFELKFKFDKKLYNHIFLHQNCVIRYLRFFYTICATRYQCAHLRKPYLSKMFPKSSHSTVNLNTDVFLTGPKKDGLLLQENMSPRTLKNHPLW